MNWYKKAQANIIEPEDHDKTYYSIGHDYLKYESEIWIWDKGSLYTENGAMSHGRLIKQLTDAGIIGSVDSGNSRIPTRYHGRYENRDGQKIISIKPSTKQHFYGTSPQLIRDLQTEYGNDIEIYPLD